MDLQNFFPYRVARLAEAVSQATAQVYGERFRLSRDEWRVLAALADAGAVKTARVIERSTLDKMRVSRAVARLEQEGLVDRQEDPQDGRGQLLRLQAKGLALYRRIVPMVQSREAFLLASLSEAERELLTQAMDKVLARAEELVRNG